MNEAIEFLIQHGAAVLFIVVFAEQVGLPLPAIPLLVAAGVLAGTGHMNLWMAIGVTLVAALLADGIWYELGRRHGRRILGLLCRIALEPNSCVRRTEELFFQHGVHSLVLAKFIPGLSTIAPPLAGIVGLSAPLFLLYDGLGVAIWTGSSIGFGYLFSDQIERAMAYTGRLAPIGALIVLGLLIAYVLIKAAFRRRELRQVPRMSVSELIEKLNTERPPLLIDLRPGNGTDVEPPIPGALRMTLDELTLRFTEFPPDRDIVLYCRCPEDATSAQGTLVLRRKGFTRVWPLAGGIEAWQRHRELIQQATSVPIHPMAIGMGVQG
jgi:membrane protein DedA with SNARE-associated domain/rhodanese-related sulfurtransferase